MPRPKKTKEALSRLKSKDILGDLTGKTKDEWVQEMLAAAKSGYEDASARSPEGQALYDAGMGGFNDAMAAAKAQQMAKAQEQASMAAQVPPDAQFVDPAQFQAPPGMEQAAMAGMGPAAQGPAGAMPPRDIDPEAKKRRMMMIDRALRGR